MSIHRNAQISNNVVLAVACLLLFSSGHASPVQTLKPVGSSELHWLFWKVYDIRLLSEDGEYRLNNFPIALAIRYHRNIDATQLVEATTDQWRKQGIHWQDQWITQLGTLWPDVKSGDELTLYVSDELHSQFFLNDRLLGEITDPEFSRAFTAIWLSEKTSEPELRQQLLGIKAETPNA